MFNKILNSKGDFQSWILSGMDFINQDLSICLVNNLIEFVKEISRNGAREKEINYEKICLMMVGIVMLSSR